MEMLTKEFFDDFISIQEKIENMKKELKKNFTIVKQWEEENLGHSDIKKICCSSSEIEEIYINSKNEVVIRTLENDDGYYSHYSYCCPLYKLISDDWKEPALKEYQKELERQREAQKIKDEELIEKERIEYERLKAKFEN